MEPLATNLDRRDILRTMGVGGAAWLTNVASVLARESESAPRGRTAKSVILLWMAGGPSQLETFDPHPGKEIAGGTGAIKTALPEIQLATGFEQLAEQMDSISLVRSLVSKEGDHERGTYAVKTGYRPDPTVVHPSIGSVVCHQLPVAEVDIPRHVSILPGNWPGRGGYLGAKYDAFKMYDPRGSVPDVRPRVSEKRDKLRQQDLDVVEQAFARGRNRAASTTRHRKTIEAARVMMSSEQLSAFDVSQEPAEVLASYGDSPFGRGCLAARRLIEVGVRCVEVTLGGWDSHVNNHEIHKANIAQLDPAFASLIADLKERKLLDQTIVLCGGEFGRTPRINPAGGRDHWPQGFSFALAGGGIAGGRVIGETDPEGRPTKKPIDPYNVADIHATVFHGLGIDPEHELITPIGRPLKLSEGQVIEKLLS